MKLIYPSLIGVLSLSVLSFCFCRTSAKETKPGNNKGFAVVELFTSEGCSSCPPADEAIINLAKEFPERVYFLGYHVDYWDYIGWKDQFSNADYTDRQNKYAEIFKLNSIYTPQAIINGQKEFVGSRESQIRTSIQEELKEDASSTIELTAKKSGAGTITVCYRVMDSSHVFLNIALVQLKAVSDVKRGENKGHRLNHINVVRELKTITVDKNANASIDFKIPLGVTANDVAIIAFVQNEKDMKIKAAVESPVE